MHDTHVHCDVLLEKLKVLATETRKEVHNFADNQGAIDMLLQLFKKHAFAIQATVDNNNFESMWNSLLKIPFIHILAGAHPEIVTLDFDVDQFLNQQKLLLSTLNLSTSAIIRTELIDPDTYWALSMANSKKLFPQLGTYKFVGLGEVGLDYFYTQDSRIIAKQQLLLEAELDFAEKKNLPVVFHCREAFDDLFAILDNHPAIHGKFLIHCFTGTRENLSEVIKRGGKVAYGGVLTFKTAQELQHTVPLCPPDSFVFETDLPFLAPTPYRGKVCLPEYIEATKNVFALLTQTSTLFTNP
jgi:TatD family hydrolase